MILKLAMDEIAARLTSAAGLQTFAWPVGSVSPPAGIVIYPEKINYDVTYKRGKDTMILPLMVLLGRPLDESTRDAVSDYCAGSGPSSIKEQLESGTYTSFNVVTVPEAEFDVVTLAGIDYLAAVFPLEISGSGS